MEVSSSVNCIVDYLDEEYRKRLMYLVDYDHVKSFLKYLNIAELRFLARRETPFATCIPNWNSCAGTMGMVLTVM